MRNWVSLHTHSDYSLQDGVTKVEDLVKKAAGLKMPAIALTDHGYLHGAVDFYQECKKAAIKPIIGVEAYLTAGNAYEKNTPPEQLHHLTLICKDKQGYHNLLKLMTIAATDCFYYKPVIDKQLLKEYSKGLICLSGCMEGEVNTHLYAGSKRGNTPNLKLAKDTIDIYKSIFGDDFYMELMYHGVKAQKELLDNSLKVIKEYGLKAVVSNDAHYANKEQGKLRDVVLADRTHSCLNDPDRKLRDLENEFYLKTIDEMDVVWSGHKEYLAATLEVAEKVSEYDPGLNDGFRLPKIGGDSSKVFQEKVVAGFKAKYPGKMKGTKEYDRLIHEVKVIQQLGFDDYFLILEDLIAYAERNDIPVGPGRGSAAGSIVSYCLNITFLDPIEYELLFERFINSGRKSLPDIDIDVCKEQRSKLIQYVKDKYGNDCVAQIITFNRMKGKGTLRAIGKVLEIDAEEIEDLAKAMPMDAQEFTISLKQIVEGDPEAPKPIVARLAGYTRNPIKKHYIDTCVALEGNYRATGVHAAGVVIGPEPLKNIVPLCRAKDGGQVIQFSMEEVDLLKLVKFDLLGLDTLTMSSACIKSINYGPIKDNNIKTFRQLVTYLGKFDDPKVYQKVFSKGDTLGVFQCDSSGIRQLLCEMNCSSFRDICAAISLYRPGPMDCLAGDTPILTGFHNYIDKDGKARIQYKYKTVKEIYDAWQIGASYKTQIISVNKDNLMFDNKIKAIQKTGKKEVYKVNIQPGLSKTARNYKGDKRKTAHIKASAGHQFLTQDGYKRLSDLVVGDYIAMSGKNYGAVRTKGIPGKKNFRERCFQNYIYSCIFCDWKEGSLDVNHLEGNRNTNNDASNLCFMCPNHHRLYSEGKITKDQAIKNREAYRLPRSEDIVFVPYIDKDLLGTEETYDIAVEGPNHNYIAADFVVHNSGIMESFILRRNHLEEEELWHECIKDYVKYTHGLPIYQEQIMFISQVMCGFTLLEADDLRKIIGKKKKEDILKFRGKFVPAAVKTSGISEEKANKIYDELEKYGRYCFNLSHAAAYAVISYVTGWLKTYYPAEFMCATLNKFVATEVDKGEDTKNIKKKDDESFLIYLWETQCSGVNVLAPSMANGSLHFKVIDSKNISYGLGAVKGIGTKLQDLIELRDKEKGFRNFAHFVYLCIKSGNNSRVIKDLYANHCLDFNISKEDFDKQIEGYARSCRCVKDGVVKPTCKLCNGLGKAKTLKTIIDDIKGFMKDEPTAEQLNIFLNSFDIKKDETVKVLVNESPAVYFVSNYYERRT